jgi:hypothetical protein
MAADSACVFLAGEENSSLSRSIGMAQYCFLLPRTDYGIVPNWNVHGLRATSALVNWKMFLARSRRYAGALAVLRVQEIVEQEIDALLNAGAWPTARRLEKEAGDD